MPSQFNRYFEPFLGGERGIETRTKLNNLYPMQQFITSAVDIESGINNFIFSFVNLVCADQPSNHLETIFEQLHLHIPDLDIVGFLI